MFLERKFLKTTTNFLKKRQKSRRFLKNDGLKKGQKGVILSVSILIKIKHFFQ